DVPGRPAARLAAARGRLRGARRLVRPVRGLLHRHDPAGDPRAVGRHHAERAAHPGRPGLLVRAARLFCAHPPGAARSVARGERKVLPAGEGRADPMTAAIPLIVLLLALLFGVPIAVALAGSGMLGIWMITGDLSKVLAIVSLTPFSTVA